MTTLDDLAVPRTAEGMLQLLDHFRYEYGFKVATTPAFGEVTANTTSREIRSLWMGFAAAASHAAIHDTSGLLVGSDRLSDVELAYFPKNRRDIERMINIVSVYGNRRGAR